MIIDGAGSCQGDCWCLAQYFLDADGAYTTAIFKLRVQAQRIAVLDVTDENFVGVLDVLAEFKLPCVVFVAVKLSDCLLALSSRKRGNTHLG